MECIFLRNLIDWIKHMEDINRYVGTRIRNYRKMKKMTLQELADRIYKSRATVSKYETGEIVLDVETLSRIAEVLEVRPADIMDWAPKRREEVQVSMIREGESPFFRADILYFYYLDGRYDRLKEAVIHINKEHPDEGGLYEAQMSLRSTSASGRSSEVYYAGNVLYSDMLIRFSFTNTCNKLEEDLLYIFNPLEVRPFTEGLLCGISSTDLMPCAFKCLVSLTPNEDYEILREHLKLTPKELRRWQKMNMFIVDNNG